MIACAVLPILILLQAVRVVVAGEYCAYDDLRNPYYYEQRYCVYGCCRNRTSSYSEVRCSYNYNIDSSTSSGSAVPFSVGPVVGGLAVLSILIGILRCCCAARYSCNKQPDTVQQANTDMHTFVVNTTEVPQGESVIPVQQEAVGFAYPSAGPPPPYGHDDNVSKTTAYLACSSSQDARY